VAVAVAVQLAVTFLEVMAVLAVLEPLCFRQVAVVAQVALTLQLDTVQEWLEVLVAVVAVTQMPQEVQQ
jgi:hypothetical protein